MKHELNHNNSFLTRTLTALATACAFAASCALASCDLFNVSVPDYFEEYTNTAAVVSHALDGSYPENSDKVTCLPSGSDRVVTFTLRNPQQYELVCSYSFSGSEANSIDGEHTYITFTQNDDKTELYATIKDTLLFGLDCSTDKDLTFTLNMTEPKSGRTFDPYTVTLSANSAPPDIDSPLCIIDTTDTNNETWILCFNMPGTTYTDSTTGIYKDIKTITIDGIAYTVTLNSSGAYTFGDTKLSTTAPASTSVNPTSKLTFTNVSGTELQSVYFSSGESMSNYKNKTYTVTCTDSAGLSSTVLVPTIAYQLSSPAACDISVSSTTLTAGGSTDNTITQQFAGDGRITISADANTTSQDSNGKPITYSSTGASIVYKVYDSDGTTLKKSGSISGLSGTVSLDPGTYIVKAFVRKSLYANSKTVSWKCTVTPTNFFVSSSGNDTNGAGTLASPYATITKAITAIVNPASGTNYTVYVLSNLTNASTASGDYITINNSNLSVTIQGSDTSGTAVQRTINAASTGSVFNITNATSVTLKNLTLAGGCAASGGGINITSGSVTLSGGTIITGNTATSNGGGIYAAGGTTILSDTTVTGNTATSKGGGIYIASGAKVTVQGGTVITPSGTGANDVYLAGNAHLSVGALTGSGTVACITPATYTVGEKLLSFTNASLSDSEKVALCDRFEVTKEGTAIYVVSPEGNNGILAQPGITIDGLAGTYTFAVSSVSGDSVTPVTGWTAGVEKPLYWVIKDSTGTIVCSSATYNENVTGAVISIYSHTTALQTGRTANDGYTGTVTAGIWIPAGDYSIKMTATIGGYEYTGSVAVTVN